MPKVKSNSTVNPSSTLNQLNNAAQALVLEIEPKLPDVILQTNPDSAKTLLYIELTTVETHILIRSLTPISFYTLHNALIEAKAPVPEVKGFALIVAKLIQRHHLILSYKKAKKEPITYTGELTVYPDGKIEFVPNSQNYNSVYTIPLITVYSDVKGAPAYSPIIIMGKGRFIH